MFVIYDDPVLFLFSFQVNEQRWCGALYLLNHLSHLILLFESDYLSVVIYNGSYLC